MKRVNKDIKKLAFENAIWKSPIITRQVVKLFYDYFNELIKQNGGEYDIPHWETYSNLPLNRDYDLKLSTRFTGDWVSSTCFEAGAQPLFI